MTPIPIIEGNRTIINQAIPVLANAFEQLKSFKDQLNTAFAITGDDPTTQGPFPVLLSFTGLDTQASPATKTYDKWDIDLNFNINLTPPDFEITKILRTCDNVEDTSL